MENFPLSQKDVENILKLISYVKSNMSTVAFYQVLINMNFLETYLNMQDWADK